jgi:hypothetical protein
VFYNDDIYTLTSSGAQSLTLTYVPDPQSLHVALNGVHATKGVDWNVDDQTLSLLSALDARTGDVVTTEYAFLEAMSAVPSEGNAGLLSGAYFTASGGDEGSTANRQVTDSSGSGWLRLTNDLNSEVGGFCSVDTFPSGDTISVTFDYADYGGTGADGLCVWLLDGSVAAPVTPTNAGGSLGYMNIGADPGLAGAVLGIGIDEKGNFSVGNGGPGVQPDRVVLRGPASGYTYLTSAATGTSVDGHSRTAPVSVTVTITAALLVTVTMDFGSGPVTVINAYDVSAAVGTPPATYRIGMSASTGADDNVHEVRDFLATSGDFTLSINGRGPS